MPIYFILFQLITSVVVFGLFHGLLFLPVILSLAGPGERKPDNLKKNQAMQYHNGYYTVHLSQNGKGRGLKILMLQNAIFAKRIKTEIHFLFRVYRYRRCTC